MRGYHTWGVFEVKSSGLVARSGRKGSSSYKLLSHHKTAAIAKDNANFHQGRNFSRIVVKRVSEVKRFLHYGVEIVL